MFNHILVPTNLTDRTADTIDTLKGLLGDRPVKVTLLHVIRQIPETNPEEFREFYAGLEERSASKLVECPVLPVKSRNYVDSSSGVELLILHVVASQSRRVASRPTIDPALAMLNSTP